jgi:hypothetical protein
VQDEGVDGVAHPRAVFDFGDGRSLRRDKRPVDGVLGVVGPVRALVNPPLDEFNLLRRKRGHPFRHAGTFLVAADALDQQAVLGVAWDNHAPADAALERLLAVAQAQPALTPFGSVAGKHEARKIGRISRAKSTLRCGGGGGSGACHTSPPSARGNPT